MTIAISIHPDLQPLAVDISTLVPLPGNPRRGDVAAVKASYAAFGQRKPIVVRRSDRIVLAGNHQLAAARDLGWEEIAVVWVDDDELTARAFALADNRTADLGTYDDQLLAEMIRGLEGDPLLAATGYTPDDLRRLLAGLDEPVSLTDADDAPALLVGPAKTALGDVWRCGPHRVMCGDATNVDHVTTLMAGDRADLLLTDPPYGVAYVGVTKARQPIRNDDLGADELGRLLSDALTNASTVMRPGAPFYVFSPSGRLETVFRMALDPVMELRQALVWVKDRHVLGRQDYQHRHESILYGWRGPDGEPQEPPFDVCHDTVLYGWRAGAAHVWESDRRQTTVWEFAKPRRSGEHPTMKPVAMLEYALTNSTEQGAVVLDLFGGSGSTLIACHRQRRTARLCELDPRYVDVICRRWQEHTGDQPILEASGKLHDFTVEV